MCWADRLTVLVCFLIAAFLFLVGGNFETMTFDGWAMLALKVFLPIWLVLRFLDWLTGGPSRRSSTRRHQIDAHWE